MFNKATKVIEAKKQKTNKGPSQVAGREYVAITALMGADISIDAIVVGNTPALKNGQPVIRMSGAQAFNGLVYVTFNEEYYTMTKSQALIEQLEQIAGGKVTADKEIFTEIEGVEGKDVKFVMTKVRYGNGLTYDNPILQDVE